jgi:hypothetical protein
MCGDTLLGGLRYVNLDFVAGGKLGSLGEHLFSSSNSHFETILRRFSDPQICYEL